MQVAQTILEQLGGRRFQIMTGAKSFVGSDTGLSFRLPSQFAKSGINAVRIQLDASDTYTVNFYRIRGVKVVPVVEEDQVYADQLRETFRRVTGLETSL